jgi:AcrR family transcriptional regulator
VNQERQTTSSLRRDAERNRRQIVTAASEVFAAHGLDVPLEEVARRAGVGIATLYRRFPTRQALIEEIFSTRLEQAVQAADEALAMEDAWEGFSTYIMRLCALQAEDCGVRDVLRMTFPTAKSLEETRARGYALLTQLIDRAKKQGSLREDFSAEDLPYLLIANGAFVAATSGIRRTAWKRYVALFLDSCRAERAHALPEPPLSGDEMFRAMLAVSADNRDE